MQVPPGMPARAIITANLRQDGQEIWSGTTITFPLRQGLMQIQRGQLPWATQQGEKPVAGPALFCIQIEGDPGGQYLGEGCVQLAIQSNTVAAPGNPNIVAAPGRVQDTVGIPGSESQAGDNALPGVATDFLQSIRPTGSLELYGQIANQPMPLTEFPSNYWGVQGYTSIDGLGLPIRADVNWISGPEAQQFGWNQLTFSIDPMALKDSVRQQISAAVQKDPEYWSGVFDQVKEEKIEEYTSKYQLPTTEMADSLLSSQIERGQMVGRMEKMLNSPSMETSQLDWQSRLKSAGLTNEQQIGRYLDSLRTVDPAAYEESLKEYSRVGQAEAMEERIEEYKSDSTWLPDWQKWEQKKAEVERLKEAEPHELLQDPKTLKQVAKKKKSWKWMSAVERFQVGTIFPQQNSLSFQGSQLTGVDIAMAPGKWYVSTTLGKMQPDAFAFGGIIPRRPPANLGRVTAGYGTTADNHLHISAQMVREQADSVSFFPRDNQVLEANGRWGFLKGAINLEAMAAISKIAYQNPLSWSDSLGIDQESQGTAWSLSADGTLFSGTSRWSVRHQQIGNSYYSLGAPWMLRNRKTSDLRWEQRFLEGKASLIGFYRQDQFPSLSPSVKPGGQELRAGGLQGSWKIKEQTRLNASWSPYYQGFAGFDSSIVARQSRYQVGISHGYKGESARGMVLGQYILGIAPRTDSLGFLLHQFMLTNQLGWKNGANLSVQLSGMFLQFVDRTQLSGTSYIQSSFFLMQRWRQEIGGGYTLLSDQKGQAYFTTRTIVPITERIQATATFRADWFRNQPEIAELPWMYLGRVGVAMNW